MSRKWAGGIVRPTPITPTGPLATGTAPGVWTIDQVAYWLRQGVWPIAGNFPPVIEDVFSTWLHTGNGTTQTINNGIDLAGKGGLVWIKNRSEASTAHYLADTLRGAGFQMQSNTTEASGFSTNGITSFTNSGFSLNGNSFDAGNRLNNTYVSWTFREQPKFFDIVTYTGNGANRTIAHNLGSVPGCIIVKRTDAAADWQVYHRSPANTQYLVLNSSAVAATGATRWNSTTPTDTVFSLGTDATVNANGGTYVAYLFAHNAGGFGETGTDNVISCGSYNGSGSANAPTITLGYEPQWLLVKRATGGTGDWNLIDNMRGFDVSGTASELNPNLANAESTGFFVAPTARGFQLKTGIAEYNASGSAYIYIAIRRGPMRTPTSGTSVFSPIGQNGGGTVTTNFVVDATFAKAPSLGTSGSGPEVQDRLRGASTNSYAVLQTPTTEGEVSGTGSGYGYANNLGFIDTYWLSGLPVIYWNFRRAPGFFDVVYYTGTGVNRTVNHNLGAVPELMIIKHLTPNDWQVYSSGLANTEYLVLNTTAAKATGATRWNLSLIHI